MTLDEFFATSIEPALAWLPPKMTSQAAMLQMGTTALQESRLEHRRQMGNGPARSFYQMERTGMVLGLLKHPQAEVRSLAIAACNWRGVEPDSLAVWNAIEHDDVFASTLARLGYWADPLPLPAVGQVDAAWLCYLRNWRPGKPHPETWPTYYAQTRAFMGLHG